MEKAEAFRALHARPGAFIIPNPWDAGTAKLLAAMGFEALATTSLGLANTLGSAAVSLDAIIENCRMVADATDLPVNADLENCGADDPKTAAKAIARAAEAGCVGGSIEGFADQLFQRGYAQISARRHIRAAEHFVRWAVHRGLSDHDLNVQILERFAGHLSRCRCGRYCCAKHVEVVASARLFLRHLQGVDEPPIRGQKPGQAEPDLLTANDAWFMPVSLKVGPDGCLYVLDWYDRYHCSQDAARDPDGVDRLKGRLYRLSYGDTRRGPKFNLAAESDDQLILKLGSGNIFFRGALPGVSSSVSGAVSVVQLSAVIGENGTTVQITLVTFLQGGTSSTIGFCGDRRSQFPMQQTVRAEFNPGQTCASIVSVVIV